jgi:hypothetical protein
MSVWRKVWLVSFAVVAVLVLALVAVRVADRGRFTAAYSSYGSGPKGTRALYLALEQLGVSMQRWPSDLARLPAGAVLVALGGCEATMARPVSRYEREELTRWVSRGGVLLVAGARSYVPAELGVSFAQDEPCVAAHDDEAGGDEAGDDETGDDEANDDEDLIDSHGDTYDAGAQHGSSHDAGVVVFDDDETLVNDAPKATPPSGLGTRWALPVAPSLAGLTMLPMRGAGTLLVEPGRPHEVLLGAPASSSRGTEVDDDDDDDDASDRSAFTPLGVSVPYGRGRVIVLASASLFTNAEVAAGLGAVLMARLLVAYAPTARVLVDEYHLGVGERRSLMRYMREVGVAQVAFLLCFVALLWLWRAGARFGPIVRAQERVPEGTASFVSAMGQLYASSSDEDGAVAILVRRACARIAAHHHVPFGSSNKLERALRERSAIDAAEAVRELSALLRNEAKRSLPARVERIDRAVARATRRDAAT